MCTRRPNILPFASSASSACETWSRPCASVRKDFGAFRRPFDRPLDLLRRPGADRLFVVNENLGAEAAADVGRDDAQLVLGRDALKRRQDDPREMRVLAGRVERYDVGAFVIVAERRARLHRVGDRSIVDEVELGHVLRRRERRVGRGLVAEMPVEHRVVGREVVHLRLPRLGGARRVDDGGQNAVVDDDLLRAVLAPPRYVSAMTTATGSPT